MIKPFIIYICPLVWIFCHEDGKKYVMSGIYI